jgi:hypothetical protein
MDYKEYKVASERHLETCLKLKDIILTNYSNSTLTQIELKNKIEILSNIYYLAGYIIEGIVSYGILKYINVEEILVKNRLSSFKKLNALNSNQRVSYHYEDRFKRWAIYNEGHNIERNLKFFSEEARLTGMNIRGIDKRLDNKELERLLKNWSVETRYYMKDQSILASNSIFAFLKLAEDIHNGIRREITKD